MSKIGTIEVEIWVETWYFNGFYHVSRKARKEGNWEKTHICMDGKQQAIEDGFGIVRKRFFVNICSSQLICIKFIFSQAFGSAFKWFLGFYTRTHIRGIAHNIPLIALN